MAFVRDRTTVEKNVPNLSPLQKSVLTLLCVILAGSTFANLAMIRRNRNLVEQVKSYTAQVSPPIGVPMPDLEGRDSSQSPVSLSLKNTNKPTVVFVFSPSCHFCKDNWSNWDSLLAKRADNGWRAVFLNVGMPTTDEFRKTHSLGDYLLEDISKKSIADYRILYTPTTLVIGRDGKIVRSWTGALKAQDMADLLQEATAIK